jgi:rare lipoprotein A
MRSRRRVELVVAAALALVAVGCAGSGAERPRASTIRDVSAPPATVGGRRVRSVEQGLATWYGPGHHGGPTASGERFDMHAMTAAHKTLRMQTMVRVVNLRNGRSVVVRINDRGPYARGRIIDVSLAAARALGMVEAGVVPVRVEVLE